MRIEFTDKVQRNLFQRYSLIDDKKYLSEDFLNKILTDCAAFVDKKSDWTADDKAHFSDVCQKLSEAAPDGFSKLLEVQCDFLYWYRLQNLYHSYIDSLTKEDNPSLYVIRALKQMVAKSVSLEYFALTDSLMSLTQKFWSKEGPNNWRVLTEVFAVFDELQENLVEQKCQLKFIDNIEICLNMPSYHASRAVADLMTVVLGNFQKCLSWLVGTKDTPSFRSLEQDLLKEFNVTEVSPEMVEFVLAAFKTLLRDRSFGYSYCPNKFLESVIPASTVENLVTVIKNESSQFPLDVVLNCLQILDGLTCIDLVKEFKDIGEKKNPYFKEACKHFNMYAQTLRTLAATCQEISNPTAEVNEMQVDQGNRSHFKSQRFLFQFLLFTQDLIELKTRDMQNSLYVQLVEPLVHIIAIQPSEGIYPVDLTCQEAALLILKTITKRSHIFDDSSLLVQILDRLKVELRILAEDLSGEPNRWRSNKPDNDLEFNSATLEKRQKFIKDSFGFLCYSIIRMDPTHIAQQANFIAHSRKILESNLFEECLMDFVFLKNTSPPQPHYEKVVDPIFMDCLQLFTYLGNDLPQKLGELIDSGLILCILHSIDRRIPVQSNMLSIVIKFFKMLNLNTRGTESLLACTAIERFFELSLDYKSYKMLVMPKGSNLMFDQRQLVHNFANENQQISDRIYSQCIKNLELLHDRSWILCKDFLIMEKAIEEAKAETDAEKAVFRDPYGKKQINYEQALEASVALLSCFCMDELEVLEDIGTHQSCVINSIRKQDVSENVIYKLLRTPIICSAADGFIYHFQESSTLILMLQTGLDGFVVYLETLGQFIHNSFADLYTILGTDDLDSLSTIESLNYCDMAEPTATQEQRDSLKNLKSEDVVWVAISKVHMLIEMVIILGTLSKFHERLGLLPHYTTFIDKFLQAKVGGYTCVAKLQSLLHRYYATVYVEAIQGQEQRRHVVLPRNRKSLEDYIWASFRESDEPYSELEDARNIYYRYELQVVQSLSDKKADDLTRTPFEFVLPEAKGVIQTFKCYKKIKNLQVQLQGNYNKRRYHFKDPLLPPQVLFNEMSAGFVADQLRLIASRCTQEEFSVEQTLKTALLIDRVLPELTRQIGYKYKNQLNGIFLFTLLNQESIIDVVGMILEWSISQYTKLNQLEGPKCLFHARNIQIIIRECLHFFLSLLKVTYLVNGNHHTYLTYFRRDKAHLMSKEEQRQLSDKCMTLTKNLLYKCVLIPMSTIIFSPTRQCVAHWHFFTGGISEHVTKIYSTLCGGGFKDPQDISNILKQQDVMPLRGVHHHHRFSHWNNQGNLGDEDDEDEDDLIPSDQISEDLILQLVSMGFVEASARMALRNYANDFEFALNALLRGEFQNLPPAPAAQTIVVPLAPAAENVEMEQTPNEEEPAKSEQIPDLSNELLYENDFGPDNEPEIIEQICKLLALTFVPCVSNALKESPTNHKRGLINKLFSFYKDFQDKPELKLKIQSLLSTLASFMLNTSADNNIPDWFFVCFTIQLLGYAKEDFVQQMNLSGLFKKIVGQLQRQANECADWTHKKLKSVPGVIPAEAVVDAEEASFIIKCDTQLYNMHVHLSLIYFLLTDFMAMQDLQTIQKLVTSQDDGMEKSAFEEPITFSDVEAIKKDALLEPSAFPSKEPVELIQQEQTRLEITRLVYDAVMTLLRNFTNVEYSVVINLKQQIQFMLGPAIKVLKQISMLQFQQEFDFRQQFLKDNGIKVLFEMSVIDSEWQAKRSNWQCEKGLETDLKEVLENVWNTPKELQKWYENLIQRQMFFQFKANFKRMSEEGKLQKDSYDYIIGGMDNTQAQAQPPQKQEEEVQIVTTMPQAQGAQTKRKQSMPAVQQPLQPRKNKSQAKQKSQDVPSEFDDSNFKVPQQSHLKRLVKKYEELNEQSFSEFVRYYNGNIFQHVIQHFGVFLAACAKVCVIKKVPKPVSPDDEESKDQQYDMKIMIKQKLLKEMLIDPNFNYGIPQKIPLKPLQKLDVPRCQADIVNQLLEMFIQQTKGYRMDILRQLREPSTISEDPTNLLELTPDKKLCIKKDAPQERRIYFFDHINILRCLVSIISRNNSVVGVILKHNDYKTVKFIFRNIYYLMAIHVDDQQRELQLNLNITVDRQLIVIGFFIHMLLTNYGSFGTSGSEKAMKKELTGIFIRQLAKSLTFKPQHDSLWAVSASLLQKQSSIWLIAKFLTMRGYENNTKDAQGAITQKKLKYHRLQRTHMVKQLIIMCNQMQPQNQVFQSDGQTSFALLESIQNASIVLQTPDLYLFGGSKNQCLSICVSVITKVLRLFENSQSLGKFFRQLDSGTPVDYSSSKYGQDEDVDMHGDHEGSEDEYDSNEDSEDCEDDSNDDFPSSNGGRQQAVHDLIDLMSDEEGQDNISGYDDEEEGEGSWAMDESHEHEMSDMNGNQVALQASQENPQGGVQSQAAVAAKQGPPASSSSDSDESLNIGGRGHQDSNSDQSDADDDEENSWDNNHDLNNEQISFQSQESSFEEQGDDYDYTDMDDDDSMNSQNQMSQEDADSEDEYAANQPQRVNRIDRRAFILSQNNFSGGGPRGVGIMSPEFQLAVMNSADHFNLDDTQGRAVGVAQLTQNVQRLIQENQGLLTASLNDQFVQLMNEQQKASNGLGGGFIVSIQQRRHQVQLLKDKVKLTEGFFQLQITTFTAGPALVQVQAIQQLLPPKTNSGTADSSEFHVHNPNDFKDHMSMPPRQLPQPKIQVNQQQLPSPALTQSQRAPNPLVIEGMDPLFMESLSAIGLQNIADSHQIHAQLTNQSQNQPIGGGQIQELIQFFRSQPQQRRQDIMRQIQQDMRRDIPAEYFAEARELFRNNREEFERIFQQSVAQPAQRAPQQLPRQGAQANADNMLQTQQEWLNQESNQSVVGGRRALPGQRDRLMSQDSVSISIDLHGPGDHSQSVLQPTNVNTTEKIEMIRGDQFVQNFFIILQDLNARYEREPTVIQTDRQAENILQQSLIPSPNDSAQTQFNKIKGTIQTAQTAFMNLDLESDQQLTQSIKILHRIPNIRICLILSVLKQGQDEIKRAREHCSQQLLQNACKPYESKLIFSENMGKENMIPFVNTVVGALKTVTQLQLTIESPQEGGEKTLNTTNKEVLEVMYPVAQDPLISKFAQLIGLNESKKSIFECLLDLMLDFWDLCKENPWVLQQNLEIHPEIQNQVIEQIHNLMLQVMREAKQKDFKLPLEKLSQVFLNRELPLSKKSLTQVSTVLNEFSETDLIQKYIETKVKDLLTQTMQTINLKLNSSSKQEIAQKSLSQQIDSTIELFKVASGVTKLKTKNICEEALLLQVFEQATNLITQEEKRVDQQTQQKEGVKNLFVFREEVKDLLMLLFSLCEYNLRLIFAKKAETVKVAPVVPDSPMFQSESSQMQIQTMDRQTLTSKQSEEPQTFKGLLESHLSPTSVDFKRFQTIMQFFMQNRKLINRFIQINAQVINKELIQVALMTPQILDFDTKRVIWKTELKRMQAKYKNERFNFTIRRDHTLQDSYAVMNSISTKQWRGGMQVEFQGEDGIDGGGLFKEWISNMSKEIFNEDMALFIKPATGGTYYPNPQSTVQPNYIDMFTFAGKVFGKALWDFQLLDCYFVKAFYKIILGMTLSYHDLEDYDSSLYKSLNWMIENTGVEAICSSFVETIEYFGEQKEIELCEGGKDLTVTDDNKYEYVQLVANYRLYKAISTQIDAFLKGLYSVIPKDLVRIFDNRELELLISGLQVIDIDDLRENTLYQNYTAQSKPVQFLFEALQEFDNVERAEFIRFVTGSSKVPVEGFRGLRASNGIQKFTVVRIPSTTQGRLPQSHTCHNQLDLPEYKDKETTKKMLLYAIKEGKTFGFA